MPGPTNLEFERAKRNPVTGSGLVLQDWFVDGIQGLPDDEDLPEDLPGNDMPRFETGIEELDRKLGGGLVGMSALIGESGLGKSIFAMSTSVAACRSGWQSILLNTELTSTNTLQRLRRCANYSQEVPSYLANGRWRSMNLHTYRNPLLVAQSIASKIQVSSNRVLLILDSLQAFVSMNARGSFFGDMGDWVNALRLVSKASEGRIACLVISEAKTNAKYDRGDKLRHATDMCIWMEPVQDAITFEIIKQRHGPKFETTAHRLDWERSRFVPAEATYGGA